MIAHLYPSSLVSRLLTSIDRASQCYHLLCIPGNFIGTEFAGGMSRPLRATRASRMAWFNFLNSTLDTRPCIVAIVSTMDAVLNEMDYAMLFLNRVITKYLSYGSIVGTYGISGILETLLNMEDAMECKAEDVLEVCGNLLHSAANQALKVNEHRAVYDFTRLNPTYQRYVNEEVSDLRGQRHGISFGGLRARCLERYTKPEVARWIMMEAIVKSGIPVKGQPGDVSFVSSIRIARSIPTLDMSFCITFDETGNREDHLALTPWWTPAGDGALYCSDSSRSWFIRWDRQLVIHNNFEVLYAPVPAAEVETKTRGMWIRWRCIELVQVPFVVTWKSVFEMGDSFVRLDTKIGSLHKKINDAFSSTRDEMHPESFNAAREVLMHIYREWPAFADVFVKGNMDCWPIVEMALETSEAGEWAKEILRRAVAGVSGSSMKVTLPNDKSVVLMANRVNSSNTDLDVKLTKGGALVQSPTGAQRVRNLVDIAKSSAALSLDQIASLITGIKMVNARLAVESLLPRKDDWVNEVFWPQVDNILLGDKGPNEPEKELEFGEHIYAYSSRHKFLALPMEVPSAGPQEG